MVTQTTLSETQGTHKPAQNKQVRQGVFAWLRPRRAVESDPGPFFPADPAPTQRIPRIAPAPPVPPATLGLPPLHRDQSTNPDPVALHIVELCVQAVRQHWSSTRLYDMLLQPLGALHSRAMREQEGGAKIGERAQNAARAAQDAADAIRAAVRLEEITGVEVPLDTAAMGRGVAMATANAHNLAEATLVGLPRITDETPDPRTATQVRLEPKESGPDHVVFEVTGGVPSPVHVDGSTPPVPDGPAETTADLPRREPRTEDAPQGGEPR